MRCNYCFLMHNNGDICPACGYKHSDPPDELFYLYPGTTLQHRYIIGRALGAGGFGIVYKAWDTMRNIPVAIKEYYPSGLVTRTPGTGYLRLVAKSRANEFEAGKHRFISECKCTIQLDREHATTPGLMHDVSSFVDNGTVYLVMEYLEGQTLTNYVEMYGPLALQGGIEIILTVLEAVRDIHKSDVVHRDISPDNMMLCANNVVKLFDFGAAKFGKDDDGKGAERVMKPGYSPPEQYEPDGKVGVHTDIYAVGATLYFALTGIKPDEATNRKDGDLLASPQSLNPHIPQNISDAILKAMAIDYRLRFKSADDFIKALLNEKIVSRPEAELKVRKLRRIVTLAASFLIVLTAGVFTYFQMREIIPALDDASIEIWHVSSGVDIVDATRADAFERIITEFNAIYPNVDVELRMLDASELEAEVRRAIYQDRPVLFQSDLLSAETLSGALDLSSAASRVSAVTLFLDGYTRLFPAGNQIPTGFSVACIFINTTITTYLGSGVSDLTSLLASMPVAESRIAVLEEHAENFTAAFGNVPFAEVSEFFADNAGALFADTSEWGAVQSVFAGRYRVLRLDIPQVPAAFGGMFSVSGGDTDERAALLRFLEFLLTEYAQDVLNIQANSGLIPLNTTAFETYKEVFGTFAQLFDNMENFAFIPRQ